MTEETQTIPIGQVFANIQGSLMEVQVNLQNLANSVAKAIQVSQVQIVDQPEPAEEAGVTASPAGPDDEGEEEQDD